MCVKQHLHPVINFREQLKYWFIGIPLVLVFAFLLSFPVIDICNGIIRIATHLEPCCTLIPDTDKE